MHHGNGACRARITVCGTKCYEYGRARRDFACHALRDRIAVVCKQKRAHDKQHSYKSIPRLTIVRNADRRKRFRRNKADDKRQRKGDCPHYQSGHPVIEHHHLFPRFHMPPYAPPYRLFLTVRHWFIVFRRPFHARHPCLCSRRHESLPQNTI
jgi:hypothetical protein